LDDLTLAQELLVAKIGAETIKFKARLAGAKIDDKPRRSSKNSDQYGKILEFRERMKSLAKEFDQESLKDCMKPL
jgi:hypothetical protein